MKTSRADDRGSRFLAGSGALVMGACVAGFFPAIAQDPKAAAPTPKPEPTPEEEIDPSELVNWVEFGIGANFVDGNWTKHCAACHGKDGRGQTKAGRMAGAKDQTDAGYQSALTDDKMFASIKEGLKEGDKEKMKPFKDKLTYDEIKALVAYVRALKK